MLMPEGTPPLVNAAVAAVGFLVPSSSVEASILTVKGCIFFGSDWFLSKFLQETALLCLLWVRM